MMRLTIVAALLAVLLLLYAVAAIILAVRVRSGKAQKGKGWPLERTVLWCVGSFLSLAAVCGPLADQAHMDFAAHMWTHLVLGMLGPLLMVCARPVTLWLRVLPVTWARRLALLLQSIWLRWISDPAVASPLNVGGLWILYTTGIYTYMHHSAVLHQLVHFHVFAAGYLFAASMLQLEPTPHRRSHMYRALWLVLALAGHGILSKFIYAHPPAGVPLSQAKAGAKLMYYGGDWIDAVIILMLCLSWYRSAQPKLPRTAEPAADPNR